MTSNVVMDLSHNNPSVDFGLAAVDGIVGVVHKATQGTGFADPQYSARRQAAADAGLLWGAYHFGTGADPVAQANWFLRTATPGPQDLVVLDFEENPAGTTMSLDQARTFIQTVQAKIGRAPGLYGGSLLKQSLTGISDPILEACWLWWAQYGPVAAIPPNWDNYTLWQYTDGHHGNPPFAVNGVGVCDRDQYQGSVDQLTAAWATGTLIVPAAAASAAAGNGGGQSGPS